VEQSGVEGSGKVSRVETEQGGSGYGEVLFKHVGLVMSSRSRRVDSKDSKEGGAEKEVIRCSC
jgi:hypothetical protein